jgi:hypothetical protein
MHTGQRPEAPYAENKLQTDDIGMFFNESPNSGPHIGKRPAFWRKTDSPNQQNPPEIIDHIRRSAYAIEKSLFSEREM